MVSFNIVSNVPWGPCYYPKVWIHYIDDTFTLWPHGDEALDSFQRHLNHQHPSFKFIREEESENKLSFLDVLVTQDGEKAIYHQCIWIATHTDRYIYFTSHHHPMVRSGTVKCLKTEQTSSVSKGTGGRNSTTWRRHSELMDTRKNFWPHTEPTTGTADSTTQPKWHYSGAETKDLVLTLHQRPLRGNAETLQRSGCEDLLHWVVQHHKGATDEGKAPLLMERGQEWSTRYHAS